jgi:putative endonuclease
MEPSGNPLNFYYGLSDPQEGSVLSPCHAGTDAGHIPIPSNLTVRESPSPSAAKSASGEAQLIAERVWHLYVLECADGSLYCGIALNVQKRLAQHQSGKGAKYTRAKLPVTLLATSAIGPDMADALKAERQFKALPRIKKLAALTSRFTSSLGLAAECNQLSQPSQSSQSPLCSHPAPGR